MTLKTRNKKSKLGDLLIILRLFVRCIVIVVLNGLICVLRSFCTCANCKWKSLRDNEKATPHIELQSIARNTSGDILSRTSVNAQRRCLKKANQARINQVTQDDKKKVSGCKDRNYSKLRPPVQELKFTREDVWTFRNGTSGLTQARVRVYPGNSVKYNTSGGRNSHNNIINHSAISFKPRGTKTSVQTGNSNAKLLRKEFGTKHCNTGWLQKGKQQWPQKANCKCCSPLSVRSHFATLSLANNYKGMQLQATQEMRYIPRDVVAKLKGRNGANDQYASQVETWEDTKKKREIECEVTPYSVDCGKNSVIPQEPIDDCVTISGALSFDGNATVSLSASNATGSRHLSMSQDASDVHSPRVNSIKTRITVKSLSKRKSFALKSCSVPTKEEASSNSPANANHTHSPVTRAPVAIKHLANSCPVDTKEKHSSIFNANPRFVVEHPPTGSDEEKREHVVATCLVAEYSPVLTTHVSVHSTLLQRDDSGKVNHAISLPNCPPVTGSECNYSDEKDVASFEYATKEEKAPAEIERPSSDMEKLWSLEEKPDFDVTKGPTAAQIVTSSILDSEVDALAELIGKLSIENSPKIESTHECLNAAQLRDGGIFMESFYPEQPPTMTSAITNYPEQLYESKIQNLLNSDTSVAETTAEFIEVQSNTAIKVQLNNHEPLSFQGAKPLDAKSPMTIAVGRQQAVSTLVDAELPWIQPDVSCTFPEHAQGNVKNNCLDGHNEQDVKVAGKNCSEYLAKRVARLEKEPMILNIPFTKQSTEQPDASVYSENLEIKRCSINRSSDLSNVQRTQDVLKVVPVHCLSTAPEVEYWPSLGEQALLQFNPLIYTLYPYTDSDMQTTVDDNFSDEVEADLYTVEQVSLPVTPGNLEAAPVVASAFTAAEEQRPQFDNKTSGYSEPPLVNFRSDHDLIDRRDHVYGTVQQTLFEPAVGNLEKSSVLSQMPTSHNLCQHEEVSTSSKHLYIDSSVNFGININNQWSLQRYSDCGKVVQKLPPILSSETPGSAATTTITTTTTTTTTVRDDKWRTRSQFIVPLSIDQIISEDPFLDSDSDDNQSDDCEEDAEMIRNVTQSNVMPEHAGSHGTPFSGY